MVHPAHAHQAAKTSVGPSWERSNHRHTNYTQHMRRTMLPQYGMIVLATN